MEATRRTRVRAEDTLVRACEKNEEKHAADGHGLADDDQPVQQDAEIADQVDETRHVSGFRLPTFRLGPRC